MAGGCGSAAVHEQAQRVVEPARQLGHAQGRHARGSQLECERDAFEPLTHTRDGGREVVGEHEAGDGRSAIDKQAHGGVLEQCSAGAWAATASGTGNALTRQVHSPAMRSAWRLVASTCTRGQARRSASTTYAHASTRCSQLSRTSSRCLGRSTLHQAVLERLLRLGADAQRRGDRLRDELRLGERGELDEIDAVVELAAARLAASSSASRVLPTPPVPVRVTRRSSASLSPMCSELRVTANEARQLQRQVVACWRAMPGSWR